MLLLVGPSTGRPGGVATWHRLVAGALAAGSCPPWEHWITDKAGGGRGSLVSRVRDGARGVARLGARLERSPVQIAHIACGSGWSFREAAALCALARRRGARTVLHVHAASWDAWLDRAPWEARLALATLRRADRVVVLSPGIARGLERRGVSEAIVRVVPNGVPVPELAPPPAGQPMRLLVVGGVSERKGAPDLLDALRQLGPARRQGLRVTWIGPWNADAAARVAWEAAGAELGLTFAGPASPTHVQSAIAAHDGFLLPSRREGLPFAILEAMAAGRPVLSTDCGAIGELLDRDAGSLVPPGDARALAAALSEWLADPESLPQRGARSRARVAAAHTLDHTMDALRAVWGELDEEWR